MIKLLLLKESMSKDNISAVADADLVVLAMDRDEWYVHKNKVTGVRGLFTTHMFKNLLMEVLNAK